jgi:GAF domain-containing protein
MKYSPLAALPFALFANTALAQDYTAALTSFYESNIRALVSAPELVSAAMQANTDRTGMDQAAIDAMDAAWRAEVGTAATPTITPILSNSAADFLRSQIEASGGKIVEAFITDSLGLNVAAAEPTSDMWQGDEDKFTKVFANGLDAVFYGEVELDESTQAYQAQISVPLIDPASNTAVGTLTVAVNADTL